LWHSSWKRILHQNFEKGMRDFKVGTEVLDYEFKVSLLKIIILHITHFLTFDRYDKGTMLKN
jgi:hypothetical protein